MKEWLFLPVNVRVVWHASAARHTSAGDPTPYDREARLEDAPERFSATSYVVWCFAQVGIGLQDELLALIESGERIVGSDLDAADLVFRTGRKDVYRPPRHSHGVGHVGIYTGEGTVLHASPYAGCVHEDAIDAFLDIENGHFRGVRRVVARI